MFALALGSSIVTLLPKPLEGTSREAIRNAVDNAPRYLRLMESWRWSGPLWDAGVISSAFDGDDCDQDLSGVYEAIRTRSELAPLRPLTQSADERLREPFKALDAVSNDLVRGGPDPGINIPITAALDHFAVRHGLCIVRGATASIAQRAEAKMGRRICAFSLPMLRRAGGARILRLRDDLSEPLDSLRTALVHLGQTCRNRDGGTAQHLIDATHAAVARFTQAFDAWSPANARGDDENDQRVTAGYLGISVVEMPADAALRSSRAAVRALAATGISESPAEPSPDRLFALVVREMNVRPEA